MMPVAVACFAIYFLFFQRAARQETSRVVGLALACAASFSATMAFALTVAFVEFPK